MRTLTFSCLSLLLCMLAGCGDDSAPGTCPTGPASPLGDACTNAGLICAYGYDPPECGGIDVVCEGGVWAERSHTDPMASCFDSGVDAGSDASADAATDASSDAGSVTCGDTSCGPSEYCFIMCTCCGVADAGPPSSTSECRPLPAGCSADALCSCAELTSTGNWCDEAARSIDQPCA
ncbi:MAG: hypothetical protein GXP55_23925 [Deltaproteobacteria bacterium]|nr:hypothetical protein [Deltaproteobacteria bacterium]